MIRKILFALVLIIAIGGAGLGFLTWQAMQGEAPDTLEAAYITANDRFIDLDGARMRVREEGPADAPPIILIHGFTHSLETWDGWAAALKTNYRVIRYDLMGHGLTGPDPLERYSPMARAETVGAVMDALGIEKAAIAGNSLGGLAAWRFAASHPDRVEALILISPGSFAMNGVSDEPADIPGAMKAYLLTAPEAGVMASAKLIYADDSRITEERVKVMRDMIHRKGNGEALIESLEVFTLPDPTADLEQVSAPTLIMWGEGDIIIPIEQGRRMAAIIPNAEMITYPGVGHAAQEEAPNVTASDAIGFLEGLKATEEASAP